MDELTTTALQEEEFNKKIDFKLWKRLLEYALRHKRTLFAGVALMLVTAFIDLVYPQLTRYAIDKIIVKGESGIGDIVPFALVYLLFVVVQAHPLSASFCSAGSSRCA